MWELSIKDAIQWTGMWELNIKDIISPTSQVIYLLLEWEKRNPKEQAHP